MASGHRWPGPLPVGPQAAVKPSLLRSQGRAGRPLGASWLPAGLPDGWRPSLPPELELGGTSLGSRPCCLRSKWQDALTSLTSCYERNAYICSLGR